MANTNELLLGWPGMALDALEAKLEGPGSASLEALFGTREVNEMRETVTAPALTRAAGQRPNIVLLPGIMGSLLQSVEGLVELLWVNPLVFTRGLINLLELADDGETDANPRVKIVATGLEMMSYAKATLVLRKQANLFLFPYDWRRDIRTAAGLLHQALNRWAASNGYRRFTLVSHSMGGLVSRTYLALFPEEAERLVERVILLGSPAYGIVNAVQNLTTGNNLMQLAHKLNDDNQGDRLVRSITALYQVLPPPPDLFPADRQYPCDFDLYDAAAWQSADEADEADGIRQNSLNRGKALYALLAASDPQVPIIQIAGYDQATLIAMRGTPDALQPVVVSHGPNSGDGAVPLWSATLPGAEMYYVRLAHDKLQRDHRVLRAVLDLARGGEADLPQQMQPHRGPVITARPPTTDVDAEARRLRAAIEDGTATADDLAQLFLAL
jgi:pimeloyl-ACP methyl ester carboxylesterase